MLEGVWGQNRLYTWLREFKGGRESVQNESEDRYSRTSLTDDNINAVRELIKRDRQLTAKEMSSKVIISYRSVQSIITVPLDFRKISAPWVPSFLSRNQNRSDRTSLKGF